MERECDVLTKYEIYIDTKENANQVKDNIEKELNQFLNKKKYSNIMTDIDLSNFEKNEDGDFVATYIIDVAYTDKCDVTLGRPSYNYYEPDEPDEIDAEEAEDQICDEIDDVLGKLKLYCYDSEVIENNSESLDDVIEKARDKSCIDVDYDYYDRD